MSGKLLLVLAVMASTGFVKISAETCESPNEVFACGSACDVTCATLGKPCPIVNIQCNNMCYCKEGYARDAKNVCIPIKTCPAKS